MNGTRRVFFGNAAKLSAAAVALLAGNHALAQGSGSMADVNILNVALGLEWEGINAYTLGAQSGLLQKPVLDVAVRFQADHKEHADTLAGAIRKMGGKPVEPKALGEYARALKADTLKSQADVLDLAAQAFFSHAGDAARGQQLYESRCIGCHSLDENRVGPAHRGVFGRKAGALKGYDYSPALKSSRLTWNENTLERWLSNPEATIPGQRMGFSVTEASDRADLIEFLRATK